MKDSKNGWWDTESDILSEGQKEMPTEGEWFRSGADGLWYSDTGLRDINSGTVREVAIEGKLFLAEDIEF